MPYEHIEYCCDYCDQKYELESHCIKHEERCEMNPDNQEKQKDKEN